MDSRNGDKIERNKIEHGRQVLRSLSSSAFLSLGVNQIAYIKPVDVMQQTAYALYAADGSRLAVIETLEGAVIAARQNDLDPVTLQ